MAQRPAPNPDQIRLVLTVVLGLSAVLMLALGVHFVAFAGQQTIGIALLVVGALEVVAALFLPRLIAERARAQAKATSR